MFIYNDVKISICICGDTAEDLPQYVLLTMEGIGLHVPVVHVFCGRTVCALAPGAGAAKVRPSVGRQCSWQSLERWAYTMAINRIKTMRFREYPGLQARPSVLQFFCEQVVMVHRQCGSGLPFQELHTAA